MDQFNYVELRGTVGSVHIYPVGSTEVAHISLATNYCYKNMSGDGNIETCWHNVTIWAGKSMPDLHQISVGTCLSLSGRLRQNNYASEDGTVHYGYDIQAASASIIPGPLTMQAGF